MKKYYKNIIKNKKFLPIIKKIFQFAIVGGLLLIVFSLLVFVYYAKDLPRPENFSDRRFIEPTRIYDRTGEVVLYTIFEEEKRDPVSFDKMPDHLKHAVIATEDANFYNHIGIDIRGIGRSIIENLRRRRVAQGGSTISHN